MSFGKDNVGQFVGNFKKSDYHPTLPGSGDAKSCQFETAPAPAAHKKTIPYPAPAPSKMSRRLRLRLRAKCPGGSGSGSGKSVPVPAAPAPAPAPHPCYIAIQELFTGSIPTSVPCSRPGQHLLSNTVRRITALVSIGIF